jgi:hypothetical protein
MPYYPDTHKTVFIGPKIFSHHNTPKTVFFDFIVAKYKAGAGLKYILSLSDPDDTSKLEEEHIKFLMAEGLKEGSCLMSALTGIMDYECICESLEFKYGHMLEDLREQQGTITE